MSIAVYAGGRSNGSPSPEAKPDLDGATLMLALVARTTPDPCEIFVVRMLRDRPTPARSVGSRAGAGEGNGSHVATRGRRKRSEDGCRIVIVVEPGPGSGDAGLEWLGMMGNGGIGGFADNGVGGTGSGRVCILEVGDAALRREGTETGLIGEGRSCREATHGYRSILEKAVIVATREFFDSVAGKKAGHERRVTTTNPNASRIPLVRTYMLSVALPRDHRCGMTNGLSLGTMPRLRGLGCSNAIDRSPE
ncbi:hypothetical protein EDB84DRAFT_1447213 [Lactarius hengduanensis]|nr:hypothetical protein EDB84DRAFT_1447213 [Lactarius hengduanensis]